MQQVHVTDHALGKMRHGENRTHLWHGEIVLICQNGLYLCLGTREGTEFRLVCDLYLEKATLLLVRRALHQEVVVSVWETFYEGIPYIITDEQVGEARRLAIEP